MIDKKWRYHLQHNVDELKGKIESEEKYLKTAKSPRVLLGDRKGFPLCYDSDTNRLYNPYTERCIGDMIVEKCAKKLYDKKKEIGSDIEFILTEFADMENIKRYALTKPLNNDVFMTVIFDNLTDRKAVFELCNAYGRKILDCLPQYDISPELQERLDKSKEYWDGVFADLSKKKDKQLEKNAGNIKPPISGSDSEESGETLHSLWTKMLS